MTIADPISPPPELAAGRRMTLREFEQVADHSGFELIDGVVETATMSEEESYYSGKIHSLLFVFVESRDLGRAYPKETVYRCFPGENFRKADASFISKARLSPSLSRKDIQVHPDLAVEVVSPSNTFSSLLAKVKRYLSVGTRLVWIIDPENQEVFVYEPGRRVVQLSIEDTLSGGDVLPDFKVTLREFFTLRPSDV